MVIATPTATNDTKEHINLPGFVGQPVVGVETKFGVSAVLKGDKAVKELVLHHYRYDKMIVPNGPNLVSFDPAKGRTLLLFLVREADGRYAPAVGQIDPELNGFKVSWPGPAATFPAPASPAHSSTPHVAGAYERQPIGSTTSWSAATTNNQVVLHMHNNTSGAAAKSAGNRPYVAAFEEQSPFYARCIPAKSTGNEGTTQILRLRPEGDEVIATYAWYNRNGIVMGWSPKAGKVAVMRVRQDEGLAVEKQIEFSFYLGDQFLRSYTTADLVKLGAKVERDASAIEDGLGASSKRAVYRVEGCKQVWGTNDYYFSVRLDETQTLSFDILTGKLCRIEKDGSKQRLIPVESAATTSCRTMPNQSLYRMRVSLCR